MALRLIVGNSGGGKTEYLYRHLIEEADRHQDQNYLVLVPEQFTLETQRDLVALHPGHSLSNIDILSFQRLSLRLMEEAGISAKKVLDDTGKNFMLKRIAEKRKGELKSLQGGLSKMGFIDEIKSFISELMQYNLKPEDVDEMIEAADQKSLQMKLEDIRLIYADFLELLGEEYTTSEGMLERVAELMTESKMLSNSVLALDGYTGFTPIQVCFLRELMVASSDLYVTVTIDSREELSRKGSMEDLFYLSRETIRLLMNLAEETGMEIAEPIFPGKGNHFRFQNADFLYHLEQNLFRKKQKKVDISENEEEKMRMQQQIRICFLPSPLEELRFAAEEIKRKVLSGKYVYSDFAVVSGAPDRYEEYAQEVFGELGIPIFIDQTQRIFFHPFVDAIRGILQILTDDFSYRSVFAYLRTGYAPFSEDEVDRLENYVLSAGIRGFSMWKKPWNRNKLHLEEEELAKINEIRERMLEHFSDFREKMTNEEASIGEKNICFYNFLLELGAGEKLSENAAAFLEEKDAVRSRQEEQIYPLVMKVMEKLTALLGDQKASVKEYKELLEAGFAATSLRVTPQQGNLVLMGDIERTRLNHIKVLFLLGANDGILPALAGEGGILSEFERKSLKEADFQLAYSAREQALMQNFYLYQNLTKPSEQLCITYAAMSADGNVQRKSFLVSAILKLFPGMQTEEINLAPSYLTPASSLLSYAEDLKAAAGGEEIRPQLQMLRKWYQSGEDWADKAKRIKNAAFLSNADLYISEEMTESLYGKMIKGSISRLEKYASCAFAHFMSYGLRLQEREAAGFEAKDIGSLLHAAIQIYTARVKEVAKSFHELDQETCLEIADFAIEAAVNARAEQTYLDKASEKAILERLKRVFCRTALTVTKQVKSGSFEPKREEARFGLQLPLEDGRQMFLNGVIDRMDEYDAEDGKKLLRIVDYKSSARTISLEDLYYGLSMQLPIYMKAALEMESRKDPKGEYIPAGIFYYAMTDPIIELINEDESKIKTEIDKSLSMKGLMPNSAEVVEATDHDPTGKQGSFVVSGLSVNKDGSISKKCSAVIPQEDFTSVLEYAEKKAIELGNQIAEGKIGAEPYEKNGVNGCEYCPYKSVCGFDKKIEGYRFRELETIGKEDILSAMREDESEIESEKAEQENLQKEEKKEGEDQ
jgi:ATP-dependent helicase/nuclease subunit B